MKKIQNTGNRIQKRGKVEHRKLANFEDLKVWQKAHQLVLKVYKITKDFPREEKFALTSQMRRAAISVPANIVEGFKKRGRRDKTNFYNIAQGSLEELKYYIMLSRDLGYLDTSNSFPNSIKKRYKRYEDIMSLVGEVGKMLYSLVNSVERGAPVF